MVIDGTMYYIGSVVNFCTLLSIYVIYSFIESPDVLQFKYRIRCLDIRGKLCKMVSINEQELYDELIILSKQTIDISRDLELPRYINIIIKDLIVYTDNLINKDKKNETECKVYCKKIKESLYELAWMSVPEQIDVTQKIIALNIFLLFFVHVFNLLLFMF